MTVFFHAMETYIRAWFGAFTTRGRVLAPLTPLRLAVLLLGFPLFMVLQLIHWLFLALDHLLFPAFCRVELHTPVFVLGVPRSGTTFLHRELAEDPRFTTTMTWEVFLAPSLCQRYFFRGIGAIDRGLGGVGSRALNSVVAWASGDLDDVHPVHLNAAEEDYLMLLPAAGCFFALLAFPQATPFSDLGRLERLSPTRRNALLDHYHGLLQRHCYAHPQRMFLSKNAAFASWAPALAQRYPDALLIICIREPLKALSSQLSSLESARALFATDPDGEELRERFIEFYSDWFAQLAEFCHERDDLVVEQEWLRGHTDAVLSEIYRRLGVDAPPRETPSDGATVSPHRHNPERYDLHHGGALTAAMDPYNRLRARAQRTT